MIDAMADLTPLGELLEHARESRGLSKREAAKRAGISEGRWRQVTSGEQKAGGVLVPVNPRPVTVVAMARAVGVDPTRAGEAAGIDREAIAAIVEATDGGLPLPASPDTVEALIEEIYADSRVPEERKHDLVRRIRQTEAERQAVRDELNRWRKAS